MAETFDHNLRALDRLRYYMESFYETSSLLEEEVKNNVEAVVDPIIALTIELLADKIGIRPAHLIAHIFVDNFGENGCRYQNHLGETILVRNNEDFLRFCEQNIEYLKNV